MGKDQLIMRENHPLEYCPQYLKLDDPTSLKVYGKLDFKILAELKEDVTLLSTFDGVEPKGNIEETKFKVSLAKKYLEDDDVFYIYGSICYPHNPLDKEELIHPLLYVNRDEDDYLKREVNKNDKNLILVYYAYRLAQKISPVILATFHTNFSNIKEWYAHLAHLPSNFEGKILDLNDDFIIVAHPPHLLEYVSGAYDFNMPSKKKEELLEIEVEKGFEIISLCHEFSKDLFLNYGLLEDLRFVSPINTTTLKNYIPKEIGPITPKRYRQNKFKEFLKEAATRDILTFIFARPLSMESFNKRLYNIKDVIENPDKFEERCDKNLKDLENMFKKYNKIDLEKRTEEEKEILKKYGLVK